MATLDFQVNPGTLFLRIALNDCCPAVPPFIGQSRMISPDVILGPQVIQTVLHNDSSNLASSIANLSEEEFDYASYNWGLSTEANFQTTTNDYDDDDLGIFASIRQHLDYNYHSYYQAPRRRLQDDIIESLLADHTPVDATSNDDDQWIIFSAGCMGAGKTHTLREFFNNDGFLFDLKTFVSVDPDEIRSKLPEFEVYRKKDPLHAGEYTGKEAGMMAEILTEEALDRGNNVLVDGSLKNFKWYKTYFESLRRKYPQLKLGIIHVTAPVEDILQRVEHRARTTGRVIPLDVLMDSMEQVPKSVDILSQHADFVLEVDNSSGHGIRFSSLQGMENLSSSFGRGLTVQ